MVPGDGCVEETALARWRCVAASLGDGALRETVQGQIQCVDLMSSIYYPGEERGSQHTYNDSLD